MSPTWRSRFLVLAFALVSLVCARAAVADPIVVAGDTVRFSDRPGTTGGGEFLATVNGTWSFVTFCLQMTEYINFTSNFVVDAVTDFAISDPSNRGGDASGHDLLDSRTAWLFTQFTDQTLVGYNYVGTADQRNASANLLQTAIWMIEEEIAMDSNQYYVQKATEALNTGWSGIGDVRVMNLERLVNGQWVESQDQLTRVPEPGTLLLMGLGSALVMLVSRVRNPLAFGRRCIPAGCVARRSNIPDILATRALPSGRIVALGAQGISHSGH